MTPLDHVVELENFREILEALTPMQLCIVALRLHGVESYRRAGDMLGLTPGCARMHMVDARRRVLRKFPELYPEFIARNGHRSWRKQGAL
jgi:DNA-directed RNA polymerase specialized sigma24 family protein